MGIFWGIFLLLIKCDLYITILYIKKSLYKDFRMRALACILNIEKLDYN